MRAIGKRQQCDTSFQAQIHGIKLKTPSESFKPDALSGDQKLLLDKAIQDRLNNG